MNPYVRVYRLRIENNKENSHEFFHDSRGISMFEVEIQASKAVCEGLVKCTQLILVLQTLSSKDFQSHSVCSFIFR